MAFGGDIRAGKAFVEIFLENRKLLRGLANTQRKLRNFGTSVTAIGRQMATASAAMLLPIAASTKLFSDFETKMALVATLLIEPEKHIANFTEGVRGLAVVSGQSTDTLADGLFDIISALVDADDAMATLNASTRLSVAGNADAKETTAALLTLMETYGDSLRDAADGADVLFTIQRRGRTTIGELAPEIGRILSTAKAAGLSLEDMGASMSLLTRATGETAIATTALGQIANSFLKPAAEGAELWAEKFGTSFDFATLQAEGMLGVLEKLSTLNPAEIAKIFPNIRAIRGILPAIAKFSGFAEDAKAMANRAGEVDKAYKIMTATVGHAYDILISGAKDAALSVGGILADSFKGWAAQATAALAIVGDFIEANPELVTTFTKVAIALGAVGAAFIAVGVTATVLSTLVGGISAALPVLGAVFTALVSPLGIFVAAIVGLATTGVLQRWIKSAISGLKSMGAMFEPIASGIGGIMKAVSFAKGIFQTLGEDFGKMWDGVIKAIGAGDMDAAVEVMTASMRLTWLRMTTWLTEQWGGFKAFWSELTSGLSSEMIDTIFAIKRVWIEALGSMQKAWAEWKASTIAEGVASGIMIGGSGQSDKQQIRDPALRPPPGVREELEEDFERRRKNLPGVKAGIDAKSRAEQDKIEADRIATKKEFADQKANRKRAHDKAIADAKKSLEDARKRRDASLAGVDTPPGAAGKGVGGGVVPGITEPALAGIAGAIRGTFSATAAAGFGGAGPAERTAKAAEMIAKQAAETLRIDKLMLEEQKRLTLEALA